MKTNYLSAICAAVACVVAMDVCARAGEIGRPGRAFDIPTVVRLGHEIHERFATASYAEALLARAGDDEESLEAKGVKGWIVTTQGGGTMVKFLAETNGQLSVVTSSAFDFTDEKEALRQFDNKTLSADETFRFSAQQLALRSIPKRFSDKYTAIALPDVDGSGFLVYALVPPISGTNVVIGGDYRFTISADAKRVEGCDQLSKSVVLLGREAAAYGVTHSIGNTPLETHVFRSLLYGKPLYLQMSDGVRWKVDGTNITTISKAKAQEGIGAKAANLQH